MLDFGFYNMDCMQGMKEFPDKYFDLAIVDPPYGINIGQKQPGTIKAQDGGMYHSPFGGVGGAKPFGKKKTAVGSIDGKNVVSPKTYKLFNDKNIPDAAYFKQLERVAKHRIIWGGNYFLDYLGATECLIVWDKKRREINFADCEIAWTDIKSPCWIFEFRWNGMLQEDMGEKEYRIHPTQKPMRLYEWLLQTFAEEGDTVLDTHVGSASSLIACRRTNHKYVGFEIDPDYYDLAKKRIETEGAQMTIFNLGFNPYQE